MTFARLEPASVLGIDTSSETWRIDSAILDALAAQIGDDHQTIERLIVFAASAAGTTIDPFQLRFGPWQLDLPAATARAIINGTVLTGTLAATHQTSIPATVLSVVVPLIFDLERVRLSTSDRYVYALLRRDLYDRRPIDDWYAELPAAVRHEIGPLEFRNLIERLRQAGLADLDLFDQLELRDVRGRRLVRLNLPPLDG